VAVLLHVSMLAWLSHSGGVVAMQETEQRHELEACKSPAMRSSDGEVLPGSTAARRGSTEIWLHVRAALRQLGDGGGILAAREWW
jgi:hypothetical protein